MPPSESSIQAMVGKLACRFALFQMPCLIAVLAYPSFLAEALAIPFFLEKLMMVPFSMLVLEALLLTMYRAGTTSSAAGPGGKALTPAEMIAGMGGGAGGLGESRCCSARGLVGATCTAAFACCMRVPFVFRLLLVYLIQMSQISLILEADATGGAGSDAAGLVGSSGGASSSSSTPGKFLPAGNLGSQETLVQSYELLCKVDVLVRWSKVLDTRRPSQT